MIKPSTLAAAILVVSCLASCAKPGGAGAGADGATGTATAASDDVCSAAKLGLGKATGALPWTPPEGCEMNGTGGPAILVTSEAEFGAAFACKGKGASGIDFSKQSLVAQRRMLSPAGVGTGVYDDGKTVTFVAKFRSACPGDPMPMPMGITLTMLVPAGGGREFKETPCNVESKCM